METKALFDAWFKDRQKSDPKHLAIKQYSDVFTGFRPVTLLEKAVPPSDLFEVVLLDQTISCATIGQPPTEWNQSGAQALHDEFLAAVFVPESMIDTSAGTIVDLILGYYDRDTLFEVTRAVLVLAGYNESRQGKDVV